MNKKIRTHYDNLGISRNAQPEVIKAAYKALAQKYHPDKNPNNPDVERIMKIINTAYQVLIDPVRRAEHDRWIDEQEAKIYDNQSTQNQNNSSENHKNQSNNQDYYDNFHTQNHQKNQQPISIMIIQEVTMPKIKTITGKITITYTKTIKKPTQKINHYFGLYMVD